MLMLDMWKKYLLPNPMLNWCIVIPVMSRVLFFGGIKSIGVEEKEIQELAEKNGGPVENVKVHKPFFSLFINPYLCQKEQFVLQPH